MVVRAPLRMISKFEAKVVRWGFHVLLAKEEEVPEQDNSVVIRYRDDETEDEDENDIDEALLHIRVDPFMSPQFENSFEGLHIPTNDDLNGARNHYRKHTSGTYDSAFESGPSGDRTPISGYPSSTSLSTQTTKPSSANSPQVVVNAESYPIDTALPRPRWYAPKPSPRISRVWAFIKNIAVRFFNGFMDFMNPPLWAMLLAIIVASVPQLQQIFFTKGTFINASVTRAVSQTGNVAVPLILVVLGANLANSTQDSHKSSHADKLETKILFASLVSRMVLPFVFIAPILALAAKFLNISILSDPVFLVVCFLLTGAPSALQLAQICQVNNVFEDVITRVLFWSYVVVILPSTLILVITAIEVVHWAV